MSENIASELTVLCGLVLFFALIVGAIVWILRNRNKLAKPHLFGELSLEYDGSIEPEFGEGEYEEDRPAETDGEEGDREESVETDGEGSDAEEGDEDNGEDDDDGYSGYIVIKLKTGNTVYIRCDSLDEYEFLDGALQLCWDGDGHVDVEGGEHDGLYNSNKERLTLLFSDVSSVKMSGL
ncbi:hypothetical protein A2415_02920 [candidate division WWE3 bacterium RIFOXYC1_FULL_39_7]|uniref:Uncharacterized protein n=1 Tax=candidate division WWE3 bacterium RIFOXYC1_FULL_39_7 TaxID=1802643 RepID=A0A1F4WIM6_UNCKA|nr:MAG: hypothetical protein A2415_02920 [candidate division WWE3 bacterium RIFOXYC1_FULL_39_7]